MSHVAVQVESLTITVGSLFLLAVLVVAAVYRNHMQRQLTAALAQRVSTQEVAIEMQGQEIAYLKASTARSPCVSEFLCRS